MSYILDALKHSDRDRNRGKVPDIQTQTLQVVETTSGKPIPYMWAGVVFLAIAIVLVAGKSILDQKTTPVVVKQSTPETSPPIATQPEAKLQVALPIKVSDPPLRNDEWLLSAEALDTVENVRINTTQARKNDLSVARTRFADNLTQQAIVTAPKAAKPAKPRPIAKKQDIAEAATLALAKPKAIPAPKPKQPDPYVGIPHQKQLPLQVQRALPELNFTVHIYSAKPASRLVKINGMRLREGDQISSALKLKEITKDGVILTYNNRPFWRTTR